MTATVTWMAQSGKTYSTRLHPIGAKFTPTDGIYIFCRQTPQDRLAAIYVGETDNLQRRLSEQLASHHRWDCIKAEGATHICELQVSGGAAVRLAIEEDLRKGLDAPCNRQ